MAITAGDFAISSGGAITDTGGSTIYSTLELHQWLQDLADNAAPVGDDNVSILGVNPSELAGKRNAARPAALTLLNGVTINDAVSHRFYFGSIEQSSGADLYTGINTIGAGLTGRSHYVVQNGSKYNSGTKWWSAGPVRALFKVKASGSLIDSGLLTVYSREWGYSYSHFDVDGSPGSEQVAALSVAADSNITRLTGNYTGGTNTVTSTTPSTTVTLTIGDTTQSLGGVSKLYKGIISWTGAARLSEVWQALQWACNETSNATLNGVAGWRYRKLNAAYNDVLAAPFGLLAGGKWFAAQGWWIDPASLNSLDLQGYTLTSHDGTTINPPVAIAVSVGAIVSGDYVLVGKDNVSGGFNTTTGITSSGSASATTVTLSGAPASDVPTGAGRIRIAGNAHSYTGIVGTTVSGLSPAVPVGGYSAAATWFPLIDKQTSTTAESSGTFNYAADFTARVRVRKGGSPSIVPFETTFAVTSAGGSVNAIRNADE
jgi:hypothetical protein